MGSKHKPSLSQSSASSSEDGTNSRASSSSHAPAPASQPTLSRWERLRRPSAASSTKRPNFGEANRSYSTSSSTVTSPTTPFFPLPSPLGGPSHDMMRTVSDDSYMHILAASAAARRAAMDSGATAPDTASVMSFTCSLSKEFDRHRADAHSLNAPLADLPSSTTTTANRMPAQQQAPSIGTKQAWLDTTFNKLSARYRTPKKGAAQKGGASTRPTKPHFLDLSSVICPTPQYTDRSTSTEDEGEAGDRSSSSSSSASASFNSGADSSFEAMSGWEDSSADTSIELRTPQNEEDRQLPCSAYDFTTPRPSQMQRFASAQSAATSLGYGMRLPSPPLISPLMPSFALPSSGASTPGLAPASAHTYGFPAPPQMSGRGVTVDDIQHKPLSVAMRSNNTTGPAIAGPPSGMRQLRKQKSFDNPAELRRRQKQEWSVDGPKPPGFGGNAKLTIGIPTPQQLQQQSQHALLSPQSVISPQMSLHTLDARQRTHGQGRSPGANQAMLPPHAAPLRSRVAEMQARSSHMQRSVSHDTAGASLQHNHALRTGYTPVVSDIDPASSTGFSTSSRQTRQDHGRPGSDRRMPTQLPVTSPLQSPIGGAVPLPPLLPNSSRESYGSSVGTESLPPTPLSTTFMRGLPLSAVDERIKPASPASPREVRIPRDLHQAAALHGAAGPMMGSALGLLPGKMVRAYSDFSHALPDEASRALAGSRLRGESISSQDESRDRGDGETLRRQVYAVQTTPRQKMRPELRREHTSNAVLVSPPKAQNQQQLVDARGEYLRGSPAPLLAAPSMKTARPASAASATITPRSSSLKDLLAAELQDEELPTPVAGATARASLDSEDSDSSLAYTKPSPLIPQGTQTGQGGESNTITPTNSYTTDLTVRASDGPSSRWSPDNSPSRMAKTTTASAGAFQGARQRANSRADEWVKTITARGGGVAAAAAAGGK
ncbi:hypothetical protein EX895_005547 [Sporisorium graminicola]|uniref:Uncharacterized protein n=1 Tax=Sporisorium graminicola TaxID=280036 RepID=A0A4U7KM28_9BASI|nr:hypothetical protein EX895_005547 [Sporisorium graminicola]TKY85385.1 hypothetical protein EX895_005547 [Sporisorium graminicola]